MTAFDSPSLTAADLDELFRRCAPRLARLVRASVNCSHALVEDACQTAWFRLAVQTEITREHSLAWLTQTALREARRMASYAEREVPLDDRLETVDALEGRMVVEDPHETIAERFRTSAVRRLTPRQQRLIWLQALGCSHDEIARMSGCTPRTVHRQLVRARARLRAADEE
jgi:RNA polymerase sigma factor (sigma-70 family)